MGSQAQGGNFVTAYSRRFGRYRVLGAMALLLLAVSLIQILSGGVGKLLEEQTGEPVRWTLSYVAADDRNIVEQVATPLGEIFVEGIAKGPVRIDMDFRECRKFTAYRFFVGPNGVDDTPRQPGEWTLFVRGVDGEWRRAGNEHVSVPYLNETWYEFPLHAGGGCVQHVRWEIAKVWSGNIFQLYEFQLYRPPLFSVVRVSRGVKSLLKRYVVPLVR